MSDDAATALLPTLEEPPHPHREPIYRVIWIQFACIAALLGGIVALWWTVSSVQHDQARDRSDARALYSQAASAGVTPVVTPAGAPTASVAVTGPPGPTGATGPGPNNEQVELAVASYCAVNVCGTGPSAAQVAQAVASYCNAAGQCKGPAGANGGQGPTGASGPTGPTGPTGAAGADGQNATAQQVADAVNAYCSEHASCAGPAGPTGDAGQPPFSWTYTSALGIQHTCTRTDPFNPDAPTYTCT